MALDESEREELARGLGQGLGDRTDTLLMEHVSAVNELTRRVEALDHKVEALDHKVDLLKHELIAEIHRVGRNQLLGFATIMAVFNTSLLAVVALIRF